MFVQINYILKKKFNEGKELSKVFASITVLRNDFRDPFDACL